MKKRIDDKEKSIAGVTDWTLLRSFLAVMREGSLSAAARYTSLTQPTLGRHISDLEAGLGVPLFTRSSSGLVPTDIALSLVEHAEAMESAFASLVRQATLRTSAEQPVGTVRIAAPEVMGIAVLPPILSEIRHRLPRVAMELSLSNKVDDVLRREADIAVRMFRPQQEGLVARKLGMVQFWLHAHQNYIQRFGMPLSLDDLKDHHLIGCDKDEQMLHIGHDGTLPLSREMFSFRVDSNVAQLMAVRAGLGIGIVMRQLAREEADLLPVLPGKVSISLECWLVVHEDQKASPTVRPVYDGLVDGLSNWIKA